jgi:tryptophanyl-tRNA synthetase
MPQKKISLSGVQSSGTLHIGNYLGMIQPAMARQTEYSCIYFIADLHSLTSLRDAKARRENSLDLVAAFLACDFDVDKHIFYRQSDVPMVTELTWYLSCVTGLGLLEKAHKFKDFTAKGEEINHGLFSYPVLMAADILMYDADVVPVGKDQKQHVEMARDIAGSFNAIYGEGLLKMPEVAIEERVMVIPGLDGRKMSKSYGNIVPLFAESKELRKTVMSIKTDSTPLEDPKVLEGTLVGQLFSLFSTQAEYRDLEKRLQAGGLGWGHAKEELFQAIEREISPVRSKYNELRANENLLHQTLRAGAERARSVSLPVLTRVREAVGVGTPKSLLS